MREHPSNMAPPESAWTGTKQKGGSSQFREIFRFALLAIIISSITAQHYLTGVSHENLALHNIHYLLYFLPILMAGIWYGFYGGAATALLVSLLYAPVVFGHVAQGVFTSNAQKALELVIYNMVGWVTGILSQRQRLESEGYKRAAEQLRAAYDKLREQTDLIVEKEEQLRQAERLSTLGELAGGIAHEVRNPLASIKGTAEILLDESTPKKKRAEFLRLMLDEVNRLNKVVANFLELARFQRLRRETADITDIFQRMLQIVDLQPARKKIEVQTRFAPDLPRISLDVSQMEQVVLNLMLNAVGAMPDGGVMKLSTSLESREGNAEIVAEIEDNGAGIEPELLPKIFDPFFTTKADGTGLGLAIVKRILKAHGGAVEITSEPGDGTRARITLPVDSENER
jgi:signal transduction histidine kinase